MARRRRVLQRLDDDLVVREDADPGGDPHRLAHDPFGVEVRVRDERTGGYAAADAQTTGEFGAMLREDLE